MMKILLRFFLLGMFAVSALSCDKEQADLDVTDPALDETEDQVYMVQYDEESEQIQKVSLDVKSEQSQVLESRSQPSSANGYWTISSGSNLSFSAIENNSGVHGQSQFHGTNSLLSAHFDSDCIFVIGNQAYFGGTITQCEVVKGSALDLAGLTAGWSIYFAVEDVGEGNNSSEDLLGGTFIAAEPEYPPICNLVYAIYTINNVPFNPGVHPTNIQVQ